MPDCRPGILKGVKEGPEMATLHYRISNFGQHWLLACEDVGIADFDSKKKALGAATDLMKAATARGDHPTLVVHPAKGTKAAA